MDTDVGDTQDAVTEGVHHVQYWIGQGDGLPDVWQQVYGIEYSPQIYQRGQYESRNDGDVVEVVRKYAVKKTAQGKQDGRQDDDSQDDKGVVNRRHPREEQRNSGHDETHNQAPEYTAGNITGQDDPVRYGRNQHFLDMALKPRPEKRGGNIGIGVVDYRHHDDPRRNEFHVGEPAHHADTGADQVAEYDEVKRHADRRRQHGLHPDTYEPGDLLGDDGLVGYVESLSSHFLTHCRPVTG